VPEGSGPAGHATSQGQIVERDLGAAAEREQLAGIIAADSQLAGAQAVDGEVAADQVPEPLTRRSTDGQNWSPSGVDPNARVVSGHAVYC
jgi:hypothetical protein